MHVQETRSIRQRKEEIERRKEESATPGARLHFSSVFETNTPVWCILSVSRAGIESAQWEPSQAVCATPTSGIPNLASIKSEHLAEASVASKFRKGRPRPHLAGGLFYYYYYYYHYYQYYHYYHYYHHH